MRGRQLLATLLAILSLLSAAAIAPLTTVAAPDNPPAASPDRTVPTPTATPLTIAEIASAQPDECFQTVSGAWPDTNPWPASYATAVGTAHRMVPPTPANCLSSENGRFKVNQAYIWGMTAGQNNDLWFGTVANTACLVEGGYLGLTTPNGGDAGSTAVCEFGHSAFKAFVFQNTGQTLPDQLGDWRPPHLYLYNPALSNGGMVDLAQMVAQQSSQAQNPAMLTTYQSLLNTTLGIRSAGSLGNVVFLAGSTIALDGINVFAFNAANHTFLGATTLTSYTDIRKWAVVSNSLVTGVQNTDGSGSVLKWTGTLPAGFTTDPTAVANLFKFDVVGNLPSEAAELVVAGSYLYVGTWPKTPNGDNSGILGFNPGYFAGIYKSPALGRTGLTTAGANKWTRVWSSLNYDPDPIVAASYAMGAMAYYGGYLYFGTMHVPGLSAVYHVAAYNDPPQSVPEQQTLYNETWRAASIWRINASGRGSAQLLYGETTLPAYQASTGSWVNKSTGYRPLYGASGFNNKYTPYDWTMAVYGNHLYVGTLDLNGMLGPQVGDPTDRGADVWEFVSTSQPAVKFSGDGLGDPDNYGVRTMVVTPSGIYAGSANPYNLDTTPDSAGNPMGGWKLYKLY